MEAIRLKIKLKKQAEKTLIRMVNEGENTGEAKAQLLDQVKIIQDLRDRIGELKTAKPKETVQ